MCIIEPLKCGRTRIASRVVFDLLIKFISDLCAFSEFFLGQVCSERSGYFSRAMPLAMFSDDIF